MARRTVLTWKFEDGPENAEGADPNDVGPAWIDVVEDESGLPIESAKISDGEWIAREEARRLARDNGYDFSEDG